ncbi:MAG: hypothetical protein ACAI35_24955 [Candidatus Methylacidiphilales bacterium]
MEKIKKIIKTRWFKWLLGIAPIIYILQYFLLVSIPYEVANVLYGKSRVPVTIYSLVPQIIAGQDPAYTQLPQLYYNPVLGKLEISKEEARQVFQGTLRWVEIRFIDRIFWLMCTFKARHAVVFDVGSNHYEVLMCFSCGEMMIYCNGQPGQSWYFKGRPDGLNAFLKSKGIPLDEPNKYLRNANNAR